MYMYIHIDVCIFVYTHLYANTCTHILCTLQVVRKPEAFLLCCSGREEDSSPIVPLNDGNCKHGLLTISSVLAYTIVYDQTIRTNYVSPQNEIIYSLEISRHRSFRRCLARSFGKEMAVSTNWGSLLWVSLQ